jgi:hypothetical protein
MGIRLEYCFHRSIGRRVLLRTCNPASAFHDRSEGHETHFSAWGNVLLQLLSGKYLRDLQECSPVAEDGFQLN